MGDLRKKILSGNGGKTVSRKAKGKLDSARSSASYNPNAPAEEPRDYSSRGTSRGTSRASSRPNSRPSSRPNSRPASRYASEAEDEGVSDSTDDIFNLPSEDLPDDLDVNSFSALLQSRLDELRNRKRSITDREDALMGYLDLLRRHFISEELMSNLAPGFISALLKSVTAGGSARERLLAVKGITVTTLTFPSDHVFDQVSQVMKGLCNDTEEEKVKAEAIHALSVTAVYGGGHPDEFRELLEFFVDIVESDGGSADAVDSGPVVTAALQAWALVATYVEDLAEDSKRAMDAFMDQLNSTDVNVQTSAGSNIGLLFEAARQYEEETGIKLDLDYNKHRIVTLMSEVVKSSPKATTRSSRRSVRSNFSSVITSLERGLGPGYSTAGRGGANPHTGGRKMDVDGEFQEFGYKEKVRVYDQVMVIDTWALRARVQALRTHLRLGFAEHFMENPNVETILESGTVEQAAAPAAMKRGPRNRGFDEEDEEDE